MMLFEIQTGKDCMCNMFVFKQEDIMDKRLFTFNLIQMVLLLSTQLLLATCRS